MAPAAPAAVRAGQRPRRGSESRVGGRAEAKRGCTSPPKRSGPLTLRPGVLGAARAVPERSGGTERAGGGAAAASPAEGGHAREARRKPRAAEGGSLLTPTVTNRFSAVPTSRAAVAHRITLSRIRLSRYFTPRNNGPSRCLSRSHSVEIRGGASRPRTRSRTSSGLDGSVTHLTGLRRGLAERRGACSPAALFYPVAERFSGSDTPPFRRYSAAAFRMW